VLGPSGCGKSTLLAILGTLESPTTGSLRLLDQNPFELPEPELARFRGQRIGFVFQDHHLLPQLSALENVLIPALATGTTNADVVQRGRELLQRVGLTQRLDHRPGELSGGERQRVAIARSLLMKPALLLADEPTGNLDRSTAATVADTLLQLQREEQTMLVIVTHSLELADRLDRRELLDGGTFASTP